MRPSNELLGRDTLLREVADALAAGRSVLLWGPEGVGKSAIIAALAGDRTVVVDPFERISRQRAARIRRALDRGVVHLAAARTMNKPVLGAVACILWRFSAVRVRELPSRVIGRIVAREIRRQDAHVAVERRWLREVVALSSGRPGFAMAMARFAVDWHRRRGCLPMPALAFMATREDVMCRSFEDAGRRPRSLAQESR